MRDLEFYSFLIKNWSEFILIFGLTFIFLYLILRKTLIAGIFDPLFLVFVVGFSTNYAVVIFLFINEYISLFLFSMVMIYAAIFLNAFVYFSKVRRRGLFSKLITLLGSLTKGNYEFKIIILLYLLISLYVLSKIGFGLFSESNRFENSRGFGAFVRLLDLFSIFITAYATLKIIRFRQRRIRILFWFLLTLFIMFSAVVNGAKISIIFSIITVYLALYIEGYKIRVDLKKVIIVFIVGVSFMLIALQINLKSNNVDTTATSTFIEGIPLVADLLIHRVVASANASYMLLPNDIIDTINKDNVLIRFLSSAAGITQMSRVMGYNVGDYSVGRQALLYYNPNEEVAGGPTSHYDLFSYVYFGFVGGLLFVAFLGFLLGVINNEMHRRANNREQSNIFISSLLATIWVRAVIVIVEPTVGFAYLIDIFVVILFLIIFLGTMKKVS